MSDSGRRSLRICGAPRLRFPRQFLVGFLLPPRRQRRAGLDQVAPFQRRRVEQRRHVRHPRFVARRRRQVRHRRGVVLVGQRAEVVGELVNEHVRRECVVGGHRAVEAVDAAAAVGAIVDDDLDGVVRGVRGEAAKRLVVEGQHVALRAERIVGAAHRVGAVDAERGPRHAAVARRRHEAPDIEVTAPLLERRGRKQHVDEPLRIGLELRPLRGGVAVAQQQDVDLRGGIAALQQLDDRPR